jgi:UDP-N-acetylmuramoyl-tripeptide--D-alanyl-D-alanine ligase
MIKLTVGEVARITGGELSTSDKNAAIKSFSIDSRTIKPGDFFIALKGQNFDGHDFIEGAAKKGCGGIIAERVPDTGYNKKIKHVLVVEDSRKAMGAIAGAIRELVSIPVICITGTNGKTTLKEMLAHLLASEYRVLKNIKSYNNIIGLSLTLFDLDPSYDIAVLELGSSHPGDIAALAEIARPDAAVITNIGDGHLEFLRDRKGVFEEKTSLLRFLPRSGVVFLNKDDELLESASAPEAATKFFGMSPGSDFRITDLERKENGYSFSVEAEKFFIPLEGKHNVYNAAAAIAAAEYFGISPDEARERLREMSLPGMRLERINAGGVIFINDSYNANPVSFECALEVLQETPAKGKKGVIAGDMLELGEREAAFHEEIGRSIAEKKIDFLITVGELAEHITRGALEAGMDKKMVFSAKDHESTAEIASRITNPGDLVLVKGSRMNKMEEVIRCFTTSYIR